MCSPRGPRASSEVQQAPKSLPLALSGLVRSLASNLLLAWTSLSLAMDLDPSELRRDSSNLSSMSCCCEQLLQSCRQAGCCLRAPPFRVHAFDHVGKDPNQFLQSRVLDPLDATAGREGERERAVTPSPAERKREPSQGPFWLALQGPPSSRRPRASDFSSVTGTRGPQTARLTPSSFFPEPSLAAIARLPHRALCPGLAARSS